MHSLHKYSTQRLCKYCQYCLEQHLQICSTQQDLMTAYQFFVQRHATVNKKASSFHLEGARRIRFIFLATTVDTLTCLDLFSFVYRAFYWIYTLQVCVFILFPIQLSCQFWLLQCLDAKFQSSFNERAVHKHCYDMFLDMFCFPKWRCTSPLLYAVRRLSICNFWVGAAAATFLEYTTVVVLEAVVSRGSETSLLKLRAEAAVVASEDGGEEPLETGRPRKL